VVSLRGITPDNFKYVCETIAKICKIIVKEDVILIKDGNVMEFGSVKEYLDHFKEHLELVKLKRLLRDESDYSRELTFLEAKLKFLNFMIAKKRTNTEIIKFLDEFETWISSRLGKIELVKLSVEHIKQTETEIADLKKKIIQVRKEIKVQDKIYKEVCKEVLKLEKNKNKKIINSLFEPDNSNGIEIFQVEEEEIEIKQEEDEI
jgi:hypothetical protein